MSVTIMVQGAPLLQQRMPGMGMGGMGGVSGDDG
jgi:hypothetical protein